MRILRFSAFFVFAIVQCAFAQNTQTSPTQQPAAQGQDKNQPQPQPSTSGDQNSVRNKNQQPVTQPGKQFKFKFFPSKPAPADKKVPTGFLDRGFRASAQRGSPEFQNISQATTVADQSADNFGNNLSGDRRRDWDRGIYAGEGTAATGRFCGSILSYNFSRGGPGEMPELESITTCTPSNKVVPRRAQGRGKNARPPLLLQTSF